MPLRLGFNRATTQPQNVNPEVDGEDVDVVSARKDDAKTDSHKLLPFHQST
jgi:hypothetical protein